MNLRIKVKFVYAESGDTHFEVYYPSNIEELNRFVGYFNSEVAGGLFSSWNLVSVHEDNR